MTLNNDVTIVCGRLSMSLHRSGHVIGNLLGAFMNGMMVHSHTGWHGLYGIFLMGGVVGALDPLSLQELQVGCT